LFNEKSYTGNSLHRSGSSAGQRGPLSALVAALGGGGGGGGHAATNASHQLAAAAAALRTEAAAIRLAAAKASEGTMHKGYSSRLAGALERYTVSN